MFSPDELQQFERDGYIIVRGLADEAIRRRMLDVAMDDLAREIPPIEYEADLSYPGAPASRDSDGGRTIRRLKQALSRSDVFVEWLMRLELTGRLRQLLGDDLVVPLAHHNCVMTKNPRYSSDTGWHQDIRYWSYTRPELVSVWLALGVEREENGCLWVIPGTHRMNFDRNRFDAETFFRSDLPENLPLIAGRIKAELQPGDALIFHARTLHAATRNHTRETKFSVVFTVRPGDNPPIAGSRSASMPELLLPAAK